jgi:hypothetical protein
MASPLLAGDIKFVELDAPVGILDTPAECGSATSCTEQNRCDLPLLIPFNCQMILAAHGIK